MARKKTLLLVVIVYFNISSCFAQDLYSVIYSAIEDCRYSRKISQYEKLNYFMNKNSYDVALTIRNYSVDSSALVRQFVINILGRTGVLCDSKYLRQNICELISEATFDKSIDVRREAINKLKFFMKSDFNKKCKDNIYISFRTRINIEPLSIKVAGFIAPSGLDSILRNVINETPKEQNDIIWAAKIALVRLGNKEAEYYCTNILEKSIVNDTVINNLVTDLIYAKTRNSINLIIKLLQIDEKNCSSTNPDYSGKILCAYRVMELLAPIIIDYPIKTTSSGDLLTNNYSLSLEKTRQWFSEHIDNYIINDSIY
jgi:hypothetical protein